MAKKTKAEAKTAAKGSKVKKKVQVKAAVKPVVMAKTVKVAKPEAPRPQVETARAALTREKAAAAAPKAKSRGRKLSIEIGPNEAATALSQKWSNLYKKAAQIQAKPYNMKSVFEERTAIVHKVLGWGYILANRNDRLEVLFQDGIKYLISNYKS